MKPPLILALLSLLACPLSADEFWIDPVNGDDAYSGSSPGDAWATLTHALAVVPSGEHLVHLAPGVYSQASGELFPLPIRTGVALQGDAGSVATRIEGGFEASGLEHHYALVARGLTLRGANHGIRIFLFHEYSVDLHLTDVRIEDMLENGIEVDAYIPDSPSSIFCQVTLQEVVITGSGGYGLLAGSSAPFGEAYTEVCATDCTFADSGLLGARVYSSSGHCCGSYEADFLRCRFTDNITGGVRVSGTEWDAGGMDLDTCLVARNGGRGVENTGGLISHTTITENTIGYFGAGALRESIVWGNTDDLTSFTGTVEYTCITDPDAPSGTGNVAADPIFVSAAAGDYRPSFVSPCIDAGDPLLPASGTGLGGIERDVDGDLDRLEESDLGAFEFTPLEWHGEAVPGGEVQLLVWGPPGWSECIFWRRGQPEAAMPTPFGDWHLGRERVGVLAIVPTLPGPPSELPLRIPPNPALVGRSFALQGLAGAGPGTASALTNVLHIQVQADG